MNIGSDFPLAWSAEVNKGNEVAYRNKGNEVAYPI
jgi:hypothetical protein